MNDSQSASMPDETALIAAQEENRCQREAVEQPWVDGNGVIRTGVLDGEEWEQAARDVLANPRPVEEIQKDIAAVRGRLRGKT